MTEGSKKSDQRIAEGSNPSAMQHAKTTDRFYAVERHIEYLQKPLNDIKNYLPYLTQEDIDGGKLYEIEVHASEIQSLFEEIKNDVRAEEYDRAVTASSNSDEVRDHEVGQYRSAYNTYQNGDWKRARSKFAVLSRTAKDTEVKSSAIKAIQMIDGHDWGEDD